MAICYIGLMSGTSMDAVDVALVDLESDTPRLVSQHSHGIPDALREEIQRLVDAPAPINQLGQLDTRLGQLFGEAVNALLQAGTVPREQVRAIGSHGQTVYHQPAGDVPFSLQIGDPNRITELTGITTVADFRRRDMAAGGQGAPLVPAFHDAVLRRSGHHRVVLNIGGIANITVLPAEPGAAVTGFDTGPGNGLLDLWCRDHTRQPYDRAGEWASGGRTIPELLEAMLSDPFFRAAPPKSTGREYFGRRWLEERLPRPLPAAQDVQRTLLELTAVSIATAIGTHAPGTREVYVCGGGVHNRLLVRRLGEILPRVRIDGTQVLGVDPDWVEAMAFAWLARQTLEGRPGNLPSVTGARRAVVLGGIYPAS